MMLASYSLSPISLGLSPLAMGTTRGGPEVAVAWGEGPISPMTEPGVSVICQTAAAVSPRAKRRPAMGR